MVKLIVTDIHLTYTIHTGRHNVYSNFPGLQFLISALNISTSFRFLSSSGTVFYTLDAKCRKEFNRNEWYEQNFQKNQFETLIDLRRKMPYKT